MTRDQQGTAVRPIYGEIGNTHELFEALGWRPSQFAWAERVLFVEGSSDVDVFQAWFKRWGWDPTMHCAIVDIEGFGTSKSLQHVVEQLQRLLAVPMLVYLDGDQHTEKSPPQVAYLPDVEVENLLLRDVAAVRKVLLEDNPSIEDTQRDLLMREWDEQAVAKFLNDHTAAKGSKKLIDLAHELHTHYSKTVHGPLIAAQWI